MDSDHDGVADAADRCAGTPMGTKVDMSGCPVVTDADADGVPDVSDRCAATAAGERVDANGCPLPKDADNDGVTDANDRCPNTAAGATVDATGCTPPPADADKDGVPNASDRCPDTSPGFSVDAAGCPNDFKEGFSSVVLRGVNFESGKATLTPSSSTVLDAVANILKASGQRVEIAGHTDNSGSAATNSNLSQSRAMAVRSYLIGKGVPAAQMTARGYGSKEPIADNATEEGKATNRRVELRKI
jgi:outer membrane protein OmpA-like peptidoglycan-associated protein